MFLKGELRDSSTWTLFSILRPRDYSTIEWLVQYWVKMLHQQSETGSSARPLKCRLRLCSIIMEKNPTGTFSLIMVCLLLCPDMSQYYANVRNCCFSPWHPRLSLNRVQCCHMLEDSEDAHKVLTRTHLHYMWRSSLSPCGSMIYRRCHSFHAKPERKQ